MEVEGLEVQNPDGSRGSLPSAYRYIAPSITGLSPTIGATAGGTEVTLLGDGFAPGATVQFSSSRAAKSSCLTESLSMPL